MRKLFHVRGAVVDGPPSALSPRVPRFAARPFSLNLNALGFNVSAPSFGAPLFSLDADAPQSHAHARWFDGLLILPEASVPWFDASMAKFNVSVPVPGVPAMKFNVPAL